MIKTPLICKDPAIMFKEGDVMFVPALSDITVRLS